MIKSIIYKNRCICSIVDIRTDMQRADYRLVRSKLDNGIMMAIKQSVYPKKVEELFSSWLYGHEKWIEEIPVELSRSIPCLICSNEYSKQSDLSLINVETNLFNQSLILFNNEQLSILFSLLEDDRIVFENAIRQQYHDYKQILCKVLKKKTSLKCFVNK